MFSENLLYEQFTSGVQGLGIMPFFAQRPKSDGVLISLKSSELL